MYARHGARRADDAASLASHSRHDGAGNLESSGDPESIARCIAPAAIGAPDHVERLQLGAAAVARGTFSPGTKRGRRRAGVPGGRYARHQRSPRSTSGMRAVSLALLAGELAAPNPIAQAKLLNRGASQASTSTAVVAEPMPPSRLAE